MAKRLDVGTSWHTCAKHALMQRFVGREVRAANSLSWIQRMCWIDLTAGNGLPANESDSWETSCSPGILAAAAASSQRKHVVIDLYEKNPDTYAVLLASLEERLPLLGYKRVAENRWRLGDLAWLRAMAADGREASIDHLGYKGTKDAVLVLNDPNIITDWAMRPDFANEILAQVKGLRIMHALGCNVCGAKRYPYEAEGTLLLDDGTEIMSLKERKNWFRLVEEQERHLPLRHDLMLSAFERDASQWAYLVTTPKVGHWPRDTEDDARRAFAIAGKTGEVAFFRQDPERFERVKARLFLTKDELAERANTPLPFDSAGDSALPSDEDPVPYRTYREYLMHPKFLAIREMVFDRADGRCERCGLRPPTEPHHLRYPPWGTFDVPENMIAVCHGCHCEIHGKAK